MDAVVTLPPLYDPDIHFGTTNPYGRPTVFAEWPGNFSRYLMTWRYAPPDQEHTATLEVERSWCPTAPPCPVTFPDVTRPPGYQPAWFPPRGGGLLQVSFSVHDRTLAPGGTEERIVTKIVQLRL